MTSRLRSPQSEIIVRSDVDAVSMVAANGQFPDKEKIRYITELCAELQEANFPNQVFSIAISRFALILKAL